MSEEVLCYNRGCGQKFVPSSNTPESCRHHRGHPVFHDAYKGWSCCKKKCTDFTEFLNIKGCTLSYHTNVKPPEVEKQALDKSNADEVIKVKPLHHEIVKIERPPFDTPLTTMKPEVSESLNDAISAFKISGDNDVEQDENLDRANIPIGTDCKNNACNAVYEGVECLSNPCAYHPGYPVFHEGLKFWTCCTKRTTDFDTFLSQPGCTTGTHVWIKKTMKGEVKCRVDWHQTGPYVYISVFGKKCDPEVSIVQLSPVRLKMCLNFPEQGGSFIKDMELGGVVDVKNSSVSMTPSKIEIKLRKGGPGSWSKLEIARKEVVTNQATEENQVKDDSPEPRVESVDLDFI